MLTSIKRFFENNLVPSDQSTRSSSDHSLQLATAALLIEMMNTDDDINQNEIDEIHRLIRDRYSLSTEETDELMKLAEQESKEATDFHQFTRLINQSYSQEQKIRIIEELWKVAMADNVLDHYEEHFVRKISDLLYISHRQFISAKLRVTESANKS